MYSFVIKIAILVNSFVVLEKILPAPGLIKPIVDEPTAEADPTSISVIINSIFFIQTFIILSIKFTVSFRRF